MKLLIKNIDLSKSLIVAILFTFVNVVIGYGNSLLFFTSLILGSFFFYFLFSAAHSLAYSLMFAINPFDFSGLSISIIIPFFLCFLVLMNKRKSSFILLRSDKSFGTLLRCIAVFTIYQVLVSYLFSEIPNLTYLFNEMKFWLLIWVIIPVYIVTYYEHKTFFQTILFIVLINIVLYYLSIFNIINLFEVTEASRYTGESEVSRLLVYDLRQITKIFVYLSPLFAIYYVRNKSFSIIILLGCFVFLAVIIAVLRTEMFYLFMGMLLSVHIGKKFLFANNAYFKLGIVVIFILIIASYLFPNLIDVYTGVLENTLNVVQTDAKDSSGEYRSNIQLPVLMNVIYQNLFFGGGKYAVSYEKTTHYLFFDIPILGAFGAYGIVGMTIYYARFIIILKRIKIVKKFRPLLEKNPIEILLVLGLFSYFLTMLLFRTLHLNLELAFESGQVELGLFIGVYFALTRILMENEEKLLTINN